MAVVSHYTEIVRQYSHTDFRQRSLSRDRDSRRYDSASDSRESSVARQIPTASVVHKERLPITPGKIITAIPPVVPLMVNNIPGKIITPIPPVIPSTPIQKAKPIAPSEQSIRRRSITGREPSLEPEAPTRGRSRRQEPANVTRRPRKSSVTDSRSTTPTRRKAPDSRPTSRNESRPQSRNESPMPRSRNVSRDRNASRAGSRASSTTRNESRPVKTGNLKGSRPSSRSSSKDRSRAGTPTEVKMERLQKALDDKRNRMRRASVKDEAAKAKAEEANATMTIETERRVRTTLSYFTDVGLLLAALYVYLFKKEILAVPIIALLLYRYIQQEINGWMPAWWRNQNRRR